MIFLLERIEGSNIMHKQNSGRISLWNNTPLKLVNKKNHIMVLVCMATARNKNQLKICYLPEAPELGLPMSSYI